MIKKIANVAACLASCVTLSVHAYDVETHEEVLTRQAANFSILQTDSSVLGNIGIEKSITDEAQTFPDTTGTPGTIRRLLEIGSRFEDSLFPTIRVLRHFYNPLTGEGLNIPAFPTQMSSPDWALARSGTVSAQERSHGNARQSLFDALTRPTEVERQAAFGETFQFLGQVVHHLQDMAQPQHVRNDVHCDWWFPCAAFGAHAPSLYESWTNDNRGSLPTDFSSIGYSITSSTFTSTFNSPRRFWNTQPPGPNSPATGKGIAEFTNLNFVSAGTNFDKPGLFPSPDFSSATSTSIDLQQLCAGAQPACVNPNLTGPVVFFGNTVVDLYTGTLQDNPRASTLSVFDPDLQKAGKPFIFTLNRFNFTAAHSFLMPRAVAYSAGMINYFFRGKIDLVPDDSNAGTYLIKNLGSEAMTGTFSLYYDYDDSVAGTVNNRTLLIGWPNTTIAANGQVNIGTIPVPTNPAPKNPGEYMLVFNGDMGAETAAEFGIGAVVGKVVKPPILIWRAYRLDAPLPDFPARVEFDLFLPQDLAQRLTSSPTAVSVQIGGLSFPVTTASQCVGRPQPCVFLRGASAPPTDVEFTITQNNAFSWPLSDGTTFSGNTPADLSRISRSALCQSGEGFENSIFATKVTVINPSVSFGQYSLSFQGNVVFQFSVSPPAADNSVVLTNVKGAGLTNVTCGVSVQ